MSEFFDSLMTGLHEAVAIERGELQGLRPKAFPNGQAVQLQYRAERKNGAFRYPHPKTMHIHYLIGQLRTVLRAVYCQVTLNYPRQRRNNPRNQFVFPQPFAPAIHVQQDVPPSVTENPSNIVSAESGYEKEISCSVIMYAFYAPIFLSLGSRPMFSFGQWPFY